MTVVSEAEHVREEVVAGVGVGGVLYDGMLLKSTNHEAQWYSSILMVNLCPFVLDRYVSAAVQMEILQCGTYTTRH